MSYVLEVCVDTVEGAIAAEKGGATRIELCGNLVIGGTSPSRYLVKEVLNQIDIPVRAMVRPRFGDFCYTDYEFEIMKKEVEDFCDLGVEGVVYGILQPNGRLDSKRMEELRKVGIQKKAALHRAFDVCINPVEALEEAKGIGFDTILTSGQKGTAVEGIELLKKLYENASGIEILAGGEDVEAKTIEKIYNQTKITSYHMPARIVSESPMDYKNPDVYMGIPSMSEYERWSCSSDIVKEAKETLDSLL